MSAPDCHRRCCYCECSYVPGAATTDPRNCFMRFFCPPYAVWAWQGCDDWIDVVLSFCCWNLFTLCCWTPKKIQKTFSETIQEETRYCCCYCHPRDKCCRFWCPLLALYAWEGTSDLVNILITLALSTTGSGFFLIALLRLAPTLGTSTLIPLIVPVVQLYECMSGGSCLAGWFAVCCWEPAQDQWLYADGRSSVVGVPVKGEGERASSLPRSSFESNFYNDADVDPDFDEKPLLNRGMVVSTGRENAGMNQRW
ncbi:unnamed protein product [Amoebophrya sp. A120]|nr:unnamed protein product [Amoebophrya sp. A120]|eukprot:GSA120T00021667001.1